MHTQNELLVSTELHRRRRDAIPRRTTDRSDRWRHLAGRPATAVGDGLVRLGRRLQRVGGCPDGAVPCPEGAAG